MIEFSMNPKTICVSVGVLILALIAQRLRKFRSILDYDRIIYQHSPGPCRFVHPIATGSEDIALMKDGQAFITSGLKSSSAEAATYSKDKGRIFMFDFHKASDPARPVLIEGDFNVDNFAPHGIATWMDKETDTGQLIVFIVNHPVGTSEDTVERFIWDDKRKILRHNKTITHPVFSFINSIAPTGPDSFFATNTQYSRWEWLRALETNLLLSWGQVIFYEGHAGDGEQEEEARVAAKGFNYPNGLALSPDGRFLHVSASLDKEIVTFFVKKDFELEEIDRQYLGTMPDNVKVDGAGDLWIGTLPIAGKSLEHSTNPSLQVPSLVLRLRLTEGKIRKLESVYEEDGSKLSASSCAAYYNRGMLIGSLHGKLMYCDVLYLEP